MVTNDPYRERTLFLLTAEGDEKAFRELFGLYARLLYPFMTALLKNHWLAEELMQETMLRVWLHRDRLPGIEHPRAWVYRIASNLALNHFQKQLSEQKKAATLQREEEQSAEGEELVALKQLQAAVREAVSLLPAQRRLIYCMSREEGMTRAMIAKQLGLSEKTVKNSIHEALKFIRTHLEQAGYMSWLLYFLLLQK